MMNELSIQRIAQVTSGKLNFGDCSIARVSTDTRSIHKGDLFVAIRGENFDAHNFLAEAVKKQAAALVVETTDSELNIPQVEVADSVAALGKIAAENRNMFSGPVIGITGSCGKTTVKTLLTDILSGCGRVLATKGNLNNHIGVPLTLFELSSEHDYAVIEMGASGPHEIGYLCGIAQPVISVVTNALRAHVEGFGSLAGVAKAKGEIYSSLPDAGVAVVNIDDASAEQWQALADNRKIITFSISNPEADFFASNIVDGVDGKVSFVLTMPATEFTVNMQLLGRHNVANALAAAACAYCAGADKTAIQSGLESSVAVDGRMKVFEGTNGAVVIDDSYNANPDSVRAAIDALMQWSKKHILVLGDLAELGSDELALHAELGEYAKSRGVEVLATCGVLSQQAALRFGLGAYSFDEHDGLIEKLKTMINSDTVVLIKGSRVSRMEKVVTALLGHGEN